MSEKQAALLDDFDAPSFGEQVGIVRADFERRFGTPPQWIAAAPGRVNLIGEHTDYNGGFVLPLAIERYTMIAAAPPKGGRARQVHVFSNLLGELADFSLDGLEPDRQDWTSYVRGVFSEFLDRDYQLGALNLLVDSRVPLGAGLSSSAALEVATATVLESVTGQRLDPVEKARLCQQAEHRFAGVPCGMMDQLSSVFGEAGKLLLIDCRSETVELAPLDERNVEVLVVNSNVRHALIEGEYAERRSQCSAAARALGAPLLRDVSPEQLDAQAEKLEPILYRRARHVTSENERTRAAAEGLRKGQLEEVGQLMYESHNSLRNDYEVSCDELDVLVELARTIGVEGGVYGARMTGGGFGGCIVSLVATGAQRGVANRIVAGYDSAVGKQATPFITRPARGAHLVQG